MDGTYGGDQAEQGGVRGGVRHQQAVGRSLSRRRRREGSRRPRTEIVLVLIGKICGGAYVEWRPARDGLTLQALDEDGDLLDDYALRAAERSLTDRPAPDALTLAVFRTAALAAGQSLAALRASLPLQASESRDLPLRHGRGEVMRELSALLRTEDTPYRPLEDGVGLSDGCGAARVQPLADRSAVRILAEAQSAEAAAELCGFLEDLVRRADEIN